MVTNQPMMPDVIFSCSVKLFVLHPEAQLQEQNKGDKDFRKRLNSLTPREMEILPLTIKGIPNKEMALKQGISFRTVELHRTNILRNTGTTNFLELAHHCEASGVSIG